MERALVESEQALAVLEPQIAADFRHVNLLLDRALAAHPHFDSFLHLETVRGWILSVRAVSSSTPGTRGMHVDYLLANKEYALRAVRDWTARALSLFGPMRSEGELAAWFVATELRE
jgi:hypothetical protein